ncbi:MAG: hypothetical protein ACP5M1_11560 [Acidiphilium sp.]
MRQVAWLLAGLLACAALSGCGRAGAPTAPGPASALTYPHQYPSRQ